MYSHPGAGLREAPLDEDLLADVPQRVGDRSGGDITPKMYILEIIIDKKVSMFNGKYLNT